MEKEAQHCAHRARARARPRRLWQYTERRRMCKSHERGGVPRRRTAYRQCVRPGWVGLLAVRSKPRSAGRWRRGSRWVAEASCDWRTSDSRVRDACAHPTPDAANAWRMDSGTQVCDSSQRLSYPLHCGTASELIACRAYKCSLQPCWCAAPLLAE